VCCARQANTINPVARMKALTAELAADGAAAASLTPEEVARQVAVLGAHHTRRRQHAPRASARPARVPNARHSL
jgi:hypothetical protein